MYQAETYLCPPASRSLRFLGNVPLLLVLPVLIFSIAALNEM